VVGGPALRAGLQGDRSTVEATGDDAASSVEPTDVVADSFDAQLVVELEEEVVVDGPDVDCFDVG
jgi:hypothetical protein